MTVTLPPEKVRRIVPPCTTPTSDLPESLARRGVIIRDGSGGVRAVSRTVADAVVRSRPGTSGGMGGGTGVREEWGGGAEVGEVEEEMRSAGGAGGGLGGPETDRAGPRDGILDTLLLPAGSTQ